MIVIEDIDCLGDLTGQRVKKREKKELAESDSLQRMAREETESKNSKITLSGPDGAMGQETGEECDSLQRMARKETTGSKNSQITLSGLLNFIDRLCRLVGKKESSFSLSNYVENSDPHLIRRGRMDKHIL